METTSANSRAPANSAEATDDLQDRIGRFARFAFIIAGTIFAVARAVDVAELRGLSVKYFDAPDRIAYEVALLVLLVSWRRCRGAPMTPLALHAFDAALTIVLSTCWGMLGWGPGARYPVSLAMPPRARPAKRSSATGGREQNLRVFLPYTTGVDVGVGVGVALVDELGFEQALLA